MTDKTLPYVTRFDRIKPGQLIEREWVFEGIRYRAEGIAHHLSPSSGGEWCTSDGGVVASYKGAETLRVLAEPSKPALPTTLGTVIACTFDGEPRLLTSCLIGHSGSGGPVVEWTGVNSDTGRTRYVTAVEAHYISDWTVVYDPSAPADRPADDGLRERVEKLAAELESRASILTTWGHLAAKLRDVLAETSAS